jgi:putative membrane protein
MKFQFKNAAYCLLLGASVFLAGACNDEGTAGDNDADSLNVANNSNNNSANDSSSLNAGDRDFITDQIESDMAEIRIAQLAQQKATSAEIKQIAKTLEADHTASLNQIKDLASRKGVTVPTEEDNDGKDLYNNLNEKTGANFDREWTEKVMDKHDKAIKKFQDKTEDNNADADLKAWAAGVLPKLRTHHDQLMAFHNKLKK